jgi:hypothetical protein
VGDVGGRASPLGDGLGRGRLRELRDSVGSHVGASFEGWLFSVKEVRISADQFLVQVEVAFFDAGFLTCEEKKLLITFFLSANDIVYF